jgi:asparagine synthase (glutamine-hydrolysing)
MPRQRAEQQLLRMVASVQHEPFYAAGTHVDEAMGAYVGWTVREGSFADGMPLANERGDVSLVFSGEEFNEPGTVLRLQARGHSVDENGASYLVHLYEEDPSFLAALNGRFHGLLVDRTNASAVLFNDRYGMHRIYYHEAPEAFYFAAEAKAILAVCPGLRSLNPQALGEFVSCGCVLENRTLFRDIHVLPPASAWVFRHGRIERKDAYFQPREWEEQPLLDDETYYQQLREVFSRNLPRYFGGSERIGTSVTGGLDTRMILAWHQAAAGSLPCYSFAGMYRESQDVSLGRKVATVCGQAHQLIPVAGDFLSQFASYAERTVYLTDGCIDVSHSPDLYINERARQIAPIRMTGNYGGEVLRRVRAFKPVEPPAGVFSLDFVSQVHAARKTYNELLDGHALSFAVFKQAPWHHYGLLSLEQTQLSVRSPFLDNELVKTVFRAPESATASDDLCLRLIADGNPKLGKLRTDRGLGGPAALRSYLEFTFKAEYAYDYGMPQWVAKADHLGSAFHLEKLFLGRHKFYHFRIWYRDTLAKYVQEVLLDPRSLSRPYLNRARVEQIVTSHVKGTGNYTTALHKLLTLELLHRSFLDRGISASTVKAPLAVTAYAVS